jgi:hypothetical protein
VRLSGNQFAFRLTLGGLELLSLAFDPWQPLDDGETNLIVVESRALST